MNFDPPAEESSNSRCSKKLEPIIQASELEEEDEPEAMGFEQDARPDDPPEDQLPA
jgi:hypothetical protein